MQINVDTMESKKIISKWESEDALRVADDNGDNDPLNIILQEEKRNAEKNAWIMEYMKI